MSALVILTIFGLSFLVTVLKGPGWAFVGLYLPTLIMLNQLPYVPLAHIPLQPYFAPLLAILLAAPFSPQSLRFKWNSVDTVVGLCVISAVITGVNTGELETGINTFRNEILRWAGPYYLSRSTFQSTDLRRFALHILIFLLGIIGIMALLEFRLQPYLYLRMLNSAGLGVVLHPMAYERFGFFRVCGPVEHPIYFGNMCVVLLGMVAVLAKTTGASLKNPWVWLALLSAFGCVIVSISFTPYIGVIAGVGVFAVLMFVPLSRPLLIPLTLAVIVGVFAFTYHVAHEPLGEKADGDLNGSYYTRKLIITESWKKAVSAGAFGYGPILTTDDDFELSSVDNSYMLFTMTKGYVYTTLWILIGVTFSVRATLGFLRAKNKSQIFPLAAGTATIFALMLSMYTVWAGAIYVIIWAMMLGLCNTVIDLVLYPELRLEAAPVRRPRVFRVMSHNTPTAMPALPGLNVVRAAGPAVRRSMP